MTNESSLSATYATFLQRAVAVLFDCLIVSIPVLLTLGPAGFLLVYLGYRITFEACAGQATPGKRLLGIYVAHLDRSRISFRESIVRTLMSYISGAIVVGHFFYFFTPKKQALHDLVANTVVYQGTRPGSLLENWIDYLKELFGTNK